MVSLTGTLEVRLEKAITFLKNYRIEEIEQALSELAVILDKKFAAMDRAFLSWDEVREMAASGLISFGSHTAGHQSW
ncbi:MAG: hypothetical protein MZV65_20840 [Chromatiales bacterium]|nr:hypothetical protein [Chromatiales bacterium]